MNFKNLTIVSHDKIHVAFYPFKLNNGNPDIQIQFKILIAHLV